MPQYRRGTTKPRVEPAPTYDVVGWVVESEAAAIRDIVSPSKRGGNVQRSTISRWRTEGFIQAFDVNGLLTLVNTQQVINMTDLPQGRYTSSVDQILPQKQDELPEYITITLKRRKGPESPKKHRGEPKSPEGKPKAV